MKESEIKIGRGESPQIDYKVDLKVKRNLQRKLLQLETRD